MERHLFDKIGPNENALVPFWWMGAHAVPSGNLSFDLSFEKWADWCSRRPFCAFAPVGAIFSFGLSLNICPSGGHFSFAQVWPFSFALVRVTLIL